jgi:hypothetical protein
LKRQAAFGPRATAPMMTICWGMMHSLLFDGDFEEFKHPFHFIHLIHDILHDSTVNGIQVSRSHPLRFRFTIPSLESLNPYHRPTLLHMIL